MPTIRAGRAGVVIGAVLVGLACGLPLGGAFAEPSDSGSTSSSESTGSDAGGSQPSGAANSVSESASDDDVKKAEDAEDKAWQDSEDATDIKASEVEKAEAEKIAAMEGALEQEKAAFAAMERMHADALAMQKAARADEKAALELMRQHQAKNTTPVFEGSTPPPPVGSMTPEVAALAAQHQQSTNEMKAAMADRAASVESMKPLIRGNDTKMTAFAELHSQQLALADLQAMEAKEVDRILADASLAEKRAAAAGQAQINETEFMNQMMAVMADVRSKLAEINDAQTESLRAITKG